MATGRINSKKMRQIIKQLEKDIYNKRPWWQRLKQWLTNW